LKGWQQQGHCCVVLMLGNDFGMCKEENLWNIAVISLIQCRVVMAVKAYPVLCNNITGMTVTVV
jgi:hypothetical protein